MGAENRDAVPGVDDAMKQHPDAIPPLSANRLENIIGLSVAVPKKTLRGRWWVHIQKVRFVNEKDALVLVASGGSAFGNARWVPLSECEWSRK